MPIHFDCTECGSEISATGFEDEEDVTVKMKCRNCLADIEIVKKGGEVKEVKIKGVSKYSGFTSAFNKYSPDDMNRIQ
jgi:transcription elongation factor Elf1